MKNMLKEYEQRIANYKDMKDKGMIKFKPATIYDFYRMCRYYRNCEKCEGCPLSKINCAVHHSMTKDEVDKVNDAVSEWILSHPVSV